MTDPTAPPYGRVLPKPSDAPVLLDHHEKMRIRAAAFRAKSVYPGPVGELLSRELLTWEEFGYRFGSQSLIKGIVDTILKTPLAEPVPVHSPLTKGA